ncbi:elongation factor P [Mycoplasma sp. 'Moose RK']|uniref:elongation factor P n=1 Tax=Mycoplasma sp. 'Moose RK' TaxID=2780095 RepID=UPI0018C2264F|nr:elongation factor P [Mycoplasma sp. 'Moose RK']MBG0730834.1 elongation factor P [Mycoplasma sp. 'Moose RK']
MINVNEFRPGITFQVENDIFVVITAQHSKQGRGQANLKAKVKNLRSGAITIKTFSGGEKVSKAHIEKVSMSFLYNDGANIVLMDDQSFEQVAIENSRVTWELNFLVADSKVKMRKFNDEILDIELPPKVELEVTSAFDAVKGNTTTNPTKRATLETGFEIDVPLFIKEGEKIIVSTEDGKYVSRGN